MDDKVRLIDANALRLMKVAECAEHTIEFAAGWKACVEYCKNDAPAIEAEPDNGWISVKDRLPDNVEEVLIYCPEFCEEIKQAIWCGEDFFVEREDLIVMPAPNGYCTHWMPLPEPPKEGDAE